MRLGRCWTALLATLVGFPLAAQAEDLARDRTGARIALDLAGGFARPRQLYLVRDGASVTIDAPDDGRSPRYVSEDRLPALPATVRIANGGAGAAGLIEALAHAWLRADQSGGAPVAWYLTDTTWSAAALAAKIVDLAITYDEATERRSLADGSAVRRDLVFMDHFMVVGPVANPARLIAGEDAPAAFRRIAEHGCAMPDTSASGCARFLSRDDASATEFKERAIFDAIFPPGQRSYLEAPWYVRCPNTPVACFPPMALSRSDADGLYTLTDLGTWLANGGAQGRLQGLAIYVSGTEPVGRPLLLNPAHALLSDRAIPEARRFLDWLLAPAGGQAIIRTFGTAQFGAPLYRVR